MDTWGLPAELIQLVTSLATLLHARLRQRLLPLFQGVFFARGRRTVASWLRAAGVGPDFRLYYYAVAASGRKVELLAFLLLRFLLRRLSPADPWWFALDDTPTKRYGPCVEGAGRHHNPTPGPTHQKFLYGHVWCTLAWVLHHPWWGPIGLPLLARLYVRQRNLKTIPAAYHWNFRTKLELAADLITWLTQWLQSDGKPLWLVADGFYAKRPVLKAARQRGVVLFSRLRRDAALRSLPVWVPAGQRGPGQPRKYGTQAWSLAKRAGHSQGWQTVEVEQYRQRVPKTYKTFLATWRPAGGVIRVVLVREDHGWLAFFCTDPNLPAATILEVMADRGTLEQDFHDLKEVEGLGQQQVRHIWASVGVYHLCLGAHPLVEWWAWERPHEELCDRRASPWDDPGRRPSHAERRKALQRWSVQQEYLHGGGDAVLPPRMRQLVQRLVQLVA